MPRNFYRKNDGLHWQASGYGRNSKGITQVERVGVHKFGDSPNGDADFAWINHSTKHLAPQDLVDVDSVSFNPASADIAHLRMSSKKKSGKGYIHRAFNDVGIVDCLVPNPGQFNAH